MVRRNEGVLSSERNRKEEHGNGGEKSDEAARQRSAAKVFIVQLPDSVENLHTGTTMLPLVVSPFSHTRKREINSGVRLRLRLRLRAHSTLE